MPRDDRFGLHDEERVTPAGPATAKGHPKHAIFGLEREPARRPAEDGNLLAKRQVLEDQIRTDPPERSEGLEQDAQREIQGSHR